MVICSKTKLRFIFKEAKWQPVWPGGKLRAPAASSTDVGQVHVTWGASTRTGVPLGKRANVRECTSTPSAASSSAAAAVGRAAVGGWCCTREQRRCSQRRCVL